MINVKHCYSYFPIFVDKKKYGLSRDALFPLHKKNKICTRCYFYPLINNFSMYSSTPSASEENLPVANRMANEVICLPLYPELNKHHVEKILSIVNNSGGC